MAAKTSMQDFQFIVSDGSRTPNNSKVRTIIRKQAMKDMAAARKNRGDYGRINFMQYRVLNRSTDAPKGTIGLSHGVSRKSVSLVSKASYSSVADSTTGPVTDMTVPRGPFRFHHSPALLACIEQYQTCLTPPAANLTNGYEALRAKYHFDIMDLCLLTSFQIGRSTMSEMARDSNLLGTLLGKQMSSYLSFVPSRYGHKPYLTAVVDCVIAKAHGIFYPRNYGYSATVLRMYGKALRAVQEAVSDEEASRDADLLCAVQMLSFSEILEPERTSAYAHHTEGTANLVRHRSPSRFSTPYEQTLFLAHIGPAFSEAFYRGEPCYLAQPEWMKLYASLAEETPSLTERSPLII